MISRFMYVSLASWILSTRVSCSSNSPSELTYVSGVGTLKGKLSILPDSMTMSSSWSDRKVTVRFSFLQDAKNKGRRRMVRNFLMMQMSVKKQIRFTAIASYLDQTLNRKCIISPSCTTYSFPSTRSFPASLQADSDPSAMKSV